MMGTRTFMRLVHYIHCSSLLASNRDVCDEHTPSVAYPELWCQLKVDLRNAEATRRDLAAAKQKLGVQQAELAQMEADREAASKAWACMNQVGALQLHSSSQ